MNTYHVWVDLVDSTADMEFVMALEQYMAAFMEEKKMVRYRLQRRKFGFGPDGLPEFHIQMDFESLTQMDNAFAWAAQRTGKIERLHHDVYSRVKNFRSGLYRDFPDPERISAE